MYSGAGCAKDERFGRNLAVCRIAGKGAQGVCTRIMVVDSPVLWPAKRKNGYPSLAKFVKPCAEFVLNAPWQIALSRYGKD
jgi:hypothetical protein